MYLHTSQTSSQVIKVTGAPGSASEHSLSRQGYRKHSNSQGVLGLICSRMAQIPTSSGHQGKENLPFSAYL